MDCTLDKDIKNFNIITHNENLYLVFNIIDNNNNIL